MQQILNYVMETTSLHTLLSADLARHIKKYALYNHTTVSNMVREALAEKTQYGKYNITIKCFPREKTTMDCAAIIDEIFTK
jgi:hypothetical protein